MESDSEIVARALKGDEEAFRIIVSRYQGLVYATALGILSDFEAAKDACQEVFLRAYLSIGSLRDSRRLGGWLRTIAVNVCRRMLASGVPAMDRSLPLESVPDRRQRADQHRERESRRVLVREAMSRLSESYREALSLHYMIGLNAVEIARTVGATPAAIRQRLRRAQMQLKKEVLSMVEKTIRDERLGPDFQEELTQILESARKAFLRADYRAAIPALERASDLAPDDTFVTLVLADANSRNRTLEELEKDSSPRDKAEKVLESLLQREPDNLAAKIKLSETRASRLPYRDLVTEHEENLRLARGTPLEPWALLRMARVYAPRGKHREARRYYEELAELEPALGGIAYVELATSCAVAKEFDTSVDCLRKAIAVLRDAPPEDLAVLSRKVFGRRYVAFWDKGVDERLYWLCQAHFDLAGILTVLGRTDSAEVELEEAVRLLGSRELAAAKDEFRRKAVTNAESRFPGLKKLPGYQKIV